MQPRHLHQKAVDPVSTLFSLAAQPKAHTLSVALKTLHYVTFSLNPNCLGKLPNSFLNYASANKRHRDLLFPCPDLTLHCTLDTQTDLKVSQDPFYNPNKELVTKFTPHLSRNSRDKKGQSFLWH